MKNKIKKITYMSIIIVIGVVTVWIVTIVNNINKMYSDYKEQAMVMKNIQEDNGESATIVENYEEVSSGLGKTVEELKEAEKVENTVEKVETKESAEVGMSKVEQKKEVKEVQEVIPDPSFIKPVEGEILKEYSKENLVYSETLKEWTTHTGIDIETELTTVVKASAEGIIKAIKDDPRYGLTVIIEHTNGFETRYSNLLTAEFVIVGEKVLQGQTIGTVGNTASFEILDKPHLHFEILKNSEYLEPTSYLK
mgnify:CR=1 FL=1